VATRNFLFIVLPHILRNLFTRFFWPTRRFFEKLTSSVKSHTPKQISKMMRCHSKVLEALIFLSVHCYCEKQTISFHVLFQELSKFWIRFTILARKKYSESLRYSLMFFEYDTFSNALSLLAKSGALIEQNEGIFRTDYLFIWIHRISIQDLFYNRKPSHSRLDCHPTWQILNQIGQVTLEETSSRLII
jgi:hypothetical protein